MLTVPLYLLQIFNRVIPSQSLDTLLFLTVIVIAALTTLAFLEAMRRLVLSQIGTWLANRLGGFVLSGSIAKSVDQYKPSSSQGLGDLSTIRRLFSGSSIFPILDIPWTPIFLLVLFLLHPTIGMITLAGAVLLFCIALYSELSTRNLAAQADKASKKSHQYSGSILRNSDVIEAMGMRNNVIRNWDNFHESKVDLQSRLSARSNRIASFAKFVRMLLQIAVIGTAGYLVLKLELTAGGLIASMLLMRRAVAPMEQAINSWKVVVKARKAFNNIEKRIGLAPELSPAQSFPLPSGYLSVRNISYTYPNRTKPTLQDLSLKVQPGEVVGITGKTAVGKSTLARLLVGLVEPDSGYIKFDGTRMTSWKSEDIGPLIGYLPQDNELFSGTVGENIARMDTIDEEELIATAKLAGVHGMIMQFPEGYEVNIGEDGAYFSGGQRQRIALARTIYKSPKLLVLDEPDANLDSEGMTALFNIIETMRQRGAITIFISHQEKVLNIADRVLRIEKGTISPVSNDRKKRGPEKISSNKEDVKVVKIEAKQS
jgi:PrtD family type I secretion system ABC transporter